MKPNWTKSQLAAINDRGRDLLVPGPTGGALGVMDWIAENFPKGSVPVSLMRQYMPMGRAAETPPFDRPVTDTEYDAVLSWMLLLGLENGFTQEPSSADSVYIPPFDFEGL